ncbi:binding-protein-dependent transport systems inner membrane component [Dinoroseobacter shibae DFL 12 = DSM 16493]|jgi:spermidine/putrescine transport system permease protein|uniref:Binding-protein-dependent transport systems inner membrane component n=1 Tax=Dinoroseobacter shibae (strain DSM 16493 / NCIMB 14021 / DFL 12) TaxID=398580 RepID=A8LSI2_DINSH|nr:ABC transporter permease subunit [Dinoroseobacter shibae]ABV92796.1 binding-protein-dependent transport systems inner membrane component [Dinoroseobacter shibae DFL 12 = DSM 16493]URF47738.1 ABC transporter permease subunit [Dinoroseobacter shibae]URF52048.1 ABC transporter permease subunit [Dinoroseobacter shibae]
MTDDYANPWAYRLKWAYMLLLVTTLMSPVLYVMYISFNANGFGARAYDFTWEWYRLVFSDELLLNALRWTFSLAIVVTLITVPFAVLAAKYYKTAQNKLPVVFLLLAPLFVPPDILGSALLVYFKSLNSSFIWLGDQLGTTAFDGWFRLSFFTATVGLIIYTIPYAFIVVLITMGRYRTEQTEAARACGADGWRAFWDIEFPQIRAGVFSACSFCIILCFNEYTRTSLLKGGFDTFTTVLISQMLNTGMSPQSYAMSSMVAFTAIAIIGSIIIFTLIRSESLTRTARAKAEPIMSS